MDDFKRFMAELNSDESVEIQNKVLRESLELYADEDGNIPQDKLMQSMVNVSRQMTIALLGAYHAWFSGEE